MKTSLSTFVILLLPLLLISSCVNSSPIYAIVSTPSDFPDQYDPNQYSYIKESFPQYITVAGGTPVYVPYDISDSELFPILDAVDGVLFVGGDAVYWTEDPKTGQREFTYFIMQMQKILEYVQDQNNKGRYMPLIGICQGMEASIMALTDSPYLLDTYVDANTHGRLNITDEGRQSKMFGWVQDKQAEYLAAKGTLFFNHMFGYNLSSLNGYEDVKESVTLTGIAEDRNDKVFMAAIEGKNWPMYIMMFHPERVLWEQQVANYTHAPEVMNFVLNLALFFSEEAHIGGLNKAPKDVLENWYFSQYEPIDIEAGTPKVYVSKGSQIINDQKSSNTPKMKRKTKAKLISK